MNGEYLLDTNVLIALREGDRLVLDRVASSTCYLSVVVLGELYYGAYKSDRREEGLEKISAVTAKFDIVEIDHEIAEHFGQIKALLSKPGFRIPENDVWLAATARRHDFTLATRDDHFSRVTGLRFEEW